MDGNVVEPRGLPARKLMLSEVSEKSPASRASAVAFVYAVSSDAKPVTRFCASVDVRHVAAGAGVPGELGVEVVDDAGGAGADTVRVGRPPPPPPPRCGMPKATADTAEMISVVLRNFILGKICVFY